MRPKTYKTKAFILKRINFGEADKILTLFSLHFGKISGIAKGIRKVTSRKAPILEPFNEVEVFLIKGKNLDLITEANLIESYAGLSKSLKKTALAFQFCELTDKFTADHQENKLIYELLKSYLEKLFKLDKDFLELELAFKKNLLKLTGFGIPPNLEDRDLDQYLEELVERKINSTSLLKKIQV